MFVKKGNRVWKGKPLFHVRKGSNEFTMISLFEGTVKETFVKKRQTVNENQLFIEIELNQ